MQVSRTRDSFQQWMSFVLTATLLLPLFLLTIAPAKATPQVPVGRKPGMTTGQKVLLIGGAALLYFLYKKHQATVAKQQVAAGAAANAAAPRMPQLYRSRRGLVYYNDPSGKAVYLTVPAQPQQVSQDDLQQYAPDYSRYRGNAPRVPNGQRTQSFSDYDPNAMAPAGQGGMDNSGGN